MPDVFLRPRRSWVKKFADAMRGMVVAVRGQSSFYFHAAAGIAVVAMAAWLRVSITEWCLLLLCITIVWTAEMFNAALEHLSRAVDHHVNEQLRDALDIASGAVLTAAIGAAIVGSVIFLLRLLF